jgi:hypothetical protein
MFLFLSSNTNKFILHTLLHLEKIVLGLIGKKTQGSYPSCLGR